MQFFKYVTNQMEPFKENETTFDYIGKHVDDYFCKGGLMRSIEILILQGTLSVLPYYSAEYQNRALFYPSMHVINMLYCVFDAITHLVDCILFLLVCRPSDAICAFLKMGIDIAECAIQLCNLIISTWSLLARNISTFLFGYIQCIEPTSDYVGLIRCFINHYFDSNDDRSTFALTSKIDHAIYSRKSYKPTSVIHGDTPSEDESNTSRNVYEHNNESQVLILLSTAAAEPHPIHLQHSSSYPPPFISNSVVPTVEATTSSYAATSVT